MSAQPVMTDADVPFALTARRKTSRIRDNMEIRVKFGRNPYNNRFTCSFCGCAFESGGFFMRLEYAGSIVDIPICSGCYGRESLFEGDIDLSANRSSHPIGRA